MMKFANVWRRDPTPGIRDVKLFAGDVFLRPAWFEDCDVWIDIRRKNRDYLTPFEPSWPKACLEKDFFKRRVERLSREWAEDRTYGFLIFENTGSALIGGININNVTRGAGQMASLGYWLGEEWQGRGCMTQAAKAVIEYAFGELRLRRMNAATLPHNLKSRNMLLRVGFSEEGFAKRYIQINGRREDHILYGLNADDLTPRTLSL